MPEFSAVVHKLGINPVVDPPHKVLSAIFAQAGKSKGPVPVRGNLNGAEFIQSLIKYQGAWRLYINGEMLRSSGLKVGDTAAIEIEFDPRPRVVPVPRKFADALRTDKIAKAEFERLSSSRQKEILRYLGSLKTEESLDRNIERTLKHLRGEKTDALHAMMRRPKNAK